MNDKLNDNDKRRIEQAAKLSWKNTITAFEDSDEISFWEGYLTGAEYATLFERQQQAKLQEFKSYVHERLDKMGIPVDPESPHKAAGCRIGGRLDIIEAERSDIRNKVIEECVEKVRYSYNLSLGATDTVVELLNSLKTK